MERYTVAGLMAANKKQSQTPYSDELLTRLPSAKSGGTSQEDRLAALSDNQRSLLGDLVERISKFVCPSSYKVGHQSVLSIGGSGSFV